MRKRQQDHASTGSMLQMPPTARVEPGHRQGLWSPALVTRTQGLGLFPRLTQNQGAVVKVEVELYTKAVA